MASVPFVLCWISFVLAYTGGWQVLARRYQAGSKPLNGATYRLCGGMMGEFGAHYGGCLHVTVAWEGLYVVPLFAFRLFHPPLLLPWSCVTSVEERRIAFTRNLEVRCEAEERKLKFLLPPQAAETIAAARGSDA